MQNRLKPAGKSFVKIAFKVTGQDDHSIKGFDALHQVRNFLVGIAVMRIFYLGPFSKNGVGFIKKKDPVAVFGFIK